MKKILLPILAMLAAMILVVSVAAEDATSYVQGDVMAIAEGDAQQTTLKHAADGTPLFSDIDYDNAAYANSVSILAKAGIVGGFPDGTFRPDNGLTRAEFCKMVNMIFGYTESDETKFIDISKDDIHCWFYDVALIAKKAGYIKGYEDDSFRGNNQLTREETCTVLNRILKLFALPLEGMDVTDAVSDWAVNDVKAVVTNFLMPLEEGNTFRATEIIKRSEVVVVLANLYTAHQEELKKQEEKNNHSGTSTTRPGTSTGGSTGGTTGGSTGGTTGGSTGGTTGGSTGGTTGGSTGGTTGGSTGGSTEEGTGGSTEEGTGGSTGESNMTPEEIAAANAEILGHLQTARNDIQEIRMNSTERSIRALFIEGFEGVMADADNGILITPDYVNEAYSAKIDDAVEIYNGMTAAQQSSFRDKLMTGIDSEAMSFLLDYFPLEKFL